MCIRLLVFEVCEVEASHAIGLQFNEAWSDDGFTKVYMLRIVAARWCAIDDSTSVIRHDEILVHQLTTYA